MKREATGSLADLYRYGLLVKDEVIAPRPKKYVAVEATIGENGVIWYKGKVYAYPSSAGTAVTRKSNNGWDFWHVFRDKGAGDYVDTSALQRFALVRDLSNNQLEFLREMFPDTHIDVSHIKMVSLDELRNRLPQGFAR